MLVAATGVLCAPASAGAEGSPAGSARLNITSEPLIQADLRAAESYWNDLPTCASEYRVEVAPTTVYGAPTAPQEAFAETDLHGCVQTWSPETWGNLLTAVSDPASLTLPGEAPANRRIEYLQWSCVLTLHEYGHSLGPPDETADPTSIMYEYSYPGMPNVPSTCSQLFPVTAPAPGRVSPPKGPRSVGASCRARRSRSARDARQPAHCGKHTPTSPGRRKKGR